MIEVHHLTKRYGEQTAVDDLSFVVEPGIVTGFLGPNGAGKSTTMRMILGLDRPTSGRATVNGKPFAEHRAPLARDRRPARGEGRPPGPTRRATTCGRSPPPPGSPTRRVDEVLDLVGLNDVAGRRSGGFSLGMGQRLGIASALLGDPAHGDARRAGQRPRPRRDPVDPQPARSRSPPRDGRCSSRRT